MKYPTVPDWERKGSTDPEHVIARWPARSTAYGVITGPSGLFVVDCDQPKADTPAAPDEVGDAADGLEALTLLAALAGEALPRTFSVRTPSGGRHLYFLAPEGLRLGNTVKSLAWCVDTRGHGGQVVGPASTINGLSYEVTDWTDPAELPAWIAERLTSPRGGGTASHGARVAPSAPPVVRLSGANVGPEWIAAALARETEAVRSAPAGSGNRVLNDSAYTLGRLVGGGVLDRAEAERELLAALDSWVFLPTPPRIVEGRKVGGETAAQARARMLRTLKRALAAGEQSPRVPEPREPRRRAA